MTHRVDSVIGSRGGRTARSLPKAMLKGFSNWKPETKGTRRPPGEYDLEPRFKPSEIRRLAKDNSE